MLGVSAQPRPPFSACNPLRGTTDPHEGPRSSFNSLYVAAGPSQGKSPPIWGAFRPFLDALARDLGVSKRERSPNPDRTDSLCTDDGSDSPHRKYLQENKLC